MSAMIKKILKWVAILVASLYGIFAIGLMILNSLSSEVTHSEDAIQQSSQSAHRMTLLSSGIHSLYARLTQIEAARHSIELEFFIYNLDEASRILTQALIKKASQGVQVRLLVDFSAPVFQLKPVYARYLKTKGIEVRYYNTSATYRLVSSQHRSHRKLLLVDGTSVITGGRNVGNEYFDLAPKYNFLDTDVEVTGPLVSTIRQSFELYWSSDLSRPPDEIERPLDPDELRLVGKFIELRPKDQEIISRVMQLGAEQAALRKAHLCSDTAFVTDYPNQGEANRKVFQQIVQELGRARHRVVAESPYFVIRKGGYKELAALNERGVSLDVLSNSLYSTDAFYTVAAMLLRMQWIARSKVQLHMFDGSPVEGQSNSEFGTEARWGIHSKRAVIDDQTVLIGTYNIDPRSANLNSEMMIVCRNQPAFAAEVLADINARLKHSSVAISGGDWNLGAVLAKASWSQLALTAVSLPISSLFDFLL